MEVRRCTFDDPELAAYWRTIRFTDGLATDTWFQSYEWHRTWWEYYGKNAAHAELQLFALVDHSQPVAIVPLVLYTRKIFGTRIWRYVRWVGDTLHPYPDIIVRRVDALAAWQEFLQYWKAHFPDAWLELSGILPNHSICTIGQMGLEMKVQEDDSYLDLDLTADHRNLFQSHSGLSTSVKRWNSSRRYAWEFHRGYDKDLTRAMIDLNLETYVEKSYFSSERNTAFFQALCSRSSDAQWYSVVAFNDLPVSIMTGFSHKERLHYFRSGTTRMHEDPNMRLGAMNRHFLFQDMVQRGYRRFDFLRGEEPYKLDYQPRRTESDTWIIHTTGKTPRSSLASMIRQIRSKV